MTRGKTTPALEQLMAAADELQQQTPGMVQLVPTLLLDCGEFSLRLAVSDGKSTYVVKSPRHLAQRVAVGERFAYGKGLAFTHGLEAFDQASRPLVQWLLATLEQGSSLGDPLPFDDGEEEAPAFIATRRRGGGSSSLPGAKRLMPLSPDQLVGFLKSQVSRRIDLECEDYSRPRVSTVEVRAGAPADFLEILEVGGDFEITALGEFAGCISGIGCALLLEDAFYLMPPESAPLVRLLHALQDNGGYLTVAREDAYLFGATLLPAMERELAVRPPESLRRFRPDPLLLQFSFDVVDGAIQVDAQALYGDRLVLLAIAPEGLAAAAEEAPPGQAVVAGIADAPPTIEGQDFYRNRAGEARALQLLLDYFPPTGVLPLASENTAADLLIHGLAQFRALGEVYTTPAFDRLIRPRAPRLQLGLSLAGDLVALDVSSDDVSVPEMFALLESYRRHRRFHRLSDGSFVSLENFEDRGLAQLVADLGLSMEDVREGRVELPTYQAFYLDQELDGVYREQGFVDYIGHFRAPAEEELLPLSPSLRGVLRPYQEAGFRWLQTLWAMGFGGILADEMGLGKTLQVIALLAALYSSALDPSGHFSHCHPERRAKPEVEGSPTPTSSRPEREARSREIFAAPVTPSEAAKISPLASLGRDDEGEREAAPTLIVCPASLVYNWTAELARFAPQLAVEAVVGTPAQREAIRSKADAQVLVTSYDLLRADAQAWEPKSLFAVILDEAHYIKNAATKTSRAVRRLQAPRRLALTGTPVENRPAELWSIFDFLMPGFLGTSMRFRERFEAPIIGDDEDALARLSARVEPFILRRRKRDVLRELPPKLETVLEVALEGEQRRLYAAAEQSLRERLNLQKNTRKARRYGYEVKGLDGGEFKTVEVLAELTRLRQIALDPALVFENYYGASAKRAAILERIGAAVDAGQKTLVFSQFTSFLDRVAEDLRAKDVPFYIITGATPKKQRAELVEAFNRDEVPVFLISLKAGGVGLNLAAATQVIHADPWWNASAQAQASDRAHRIGQRSVVNVCQVVAAGTIEARMMRLQQMKAELADSLIGATAGDTLTTLTPELLIDLLED